MLFYFVKRLALELDYGLLFSDSDMHLQSLCVESRAETGKNSKAKQNSQRDYWFHIIAYELFIS